MNLLLLKDLQAKATALKNGLIDAAEAVPCALRRATTCLAVEAARELTPQEKALGWASRTFERYNPDVLCLSCSAYWHASLAANALDNLHALHVRTAARTQTPNPPEKSNAVTDPAATAAAANLFALTNAHD